MDVREMSTHSQQKKRRITITSALPYANGDIHLGHMVEHLITDMWARFQKMRGHDCVAICADDTHGAPIMIKAKKLGLKPEDFIKEVQVRHEKDLQDFEVNYDHYSNTNTELNRSHCDLFYKALRDSKNIYSKEMQQFYCEHDKMFLPDRFVVGSCPKCQTPNQHGDSCESCGAVYEPTEIKDPSCALCSKTPVVKNSKHQFVNLAKFSDFLKSWVSKHVDSGIVKKLDEWLNSGLKDWCLTRDAPYFGFELPDHPGKFYYVWFDAPIGYLSASKEWCKKNNKDIKDFWQNKDAEIYHNVGKDIVYFHALFWPVMLKAAGYNTPTKVFVHGMLTINGEKLSKSRGTFINARTYLNHLPATYLRYYLGSKLSDNIADLDLNLDDFVAKVNSDLIGKITNIASRGFQMLNKNFAGELAKDLDSEAKELIEIAQKSSETIAEHFEKRQFAKALVCIRELADQTNKYFDDNKPWKLIKEDRQKTQIILTAILNIFRILAIYLKPVIPSYSKKAAELFVEKDYLWADAQKTLRAQKVAKFSRLLDRIEPKKIKKIIEESKTVMQETQTQTQKTDSNTITIDDLAKIDLRVATIVEASLVEGADKLVRLRVDLGQELGEKQIFAGIKASYQPEDLTGTKVVVVNNLKPRKMKFGLSEGMLLAAAGKDTDSAWLVRPDLGAKAGMSIS
jgi:methionyl-tRNA synthetase